MMSDRTAALSGMSGLFSTKRSRLLCAVFIEASFPEKNEDDEGL